MKELISVSDFGSIRVLGIPLGGATTFTKAVLKNFELTDDEPRYLEISDVTDGHLPKFKVRFCKDDEGRVNEIKILNPKLNQKDCDVLYNYFKTKLNTLNVITEQSDEATTNLVLSNYLHRVFFIKQKGLGDNENRCTLIITINGRLIDGHFVHLHNSDEQRKTAIRELYLTAGKTREIAKKYNFTSQVLKVLLCVCALIVAYLFALNGRYIMEDDQCYFDKWTKTIIFIERIKDIK